MIPRIPKAAKFQDGDTCDMNLDYRLLSRLKERLMFVRRNEKNENELWVIKRMENVYLRCPKNGIKYVRQRFSMSPIKCYGEVWDYKGCSIVKFSIGEEVYETHRIEGWRIYKTDYILFNPYNPDMEVAEIICKAIYEHRKTLSLT